jgi:hypothetical protein
MAMAAGKEMTLLYVDEQAEMMLLELQFVIRHIPSIFPSSSKRSFCLSRLRFSLSDLCTFFGALFSHFLFKIGLSESNVQFFVRRWFNMKR